MNQGKTNLELEARAMIFFDFASGKQSEHSLHRLKRCLFLLEIQLYVEALEEGGSQINWAGASKLIRMRGTHTRTHTHTEWSKKINLAKLVFEVLRTSKAAEASVDHYADARAKHLEIGTKQGRMIDLGKQQATESQAKQAKQNLALFHGMSCQNDGAGLGHFGNHLQNRQQAWKQKKGRVEGRMRVPST